MVFCPEGQNIDALLPRLLQLDGYEIGKRCGKLHAARQLDERRYGFRRKPAIRGVAELLSPHKDLGFLSVGHERHAVLPYGVPRVRQRHLCPHVSQTSSTRHTFYSAISSMDGRGAAMHLTFIV